MQAVRCCGQQDGHRALPSQSPLTQFISSPDHLAASSLYDSREVCLMFLGTWHCVLLEVFSLFKIEWNVSLSELVMGSAM